MKLISDDSLLGRTKRDVIIVEILQARFSREFQHQERSQRRPKAIFCNFIVA